MYERSIRALRQTPIKTSKNLIVLIKYFKTL